MKPLSPEVDRIAKDKAVADKRDNVKANAKEKGKTKPLTDKQRIDVIWQYLGLDE